MNKIKTVGSPKTVILQDQSGKPLPGIPVHLGARYASTNLLGEALFLGMDDGEYEVRIDAAGYRPVRKIASITATLRNHQFVLQPSGLGGIKGRIRLACADIPLPDTEIRLTPIHPEETGSEPFCLRTDWDGQYEGRSIPQGDYTYRAIAAHCKPAEGTCRIGNEPCSLDLSLEHVPEPCRVVVTVRTSDGSEVTRSRVRLIGGMDAVTFAEKEGTDRCIFEYLDKAPFGSFASGDKLFCSPDFVVSVEVEGCHTGYSVCSLRNTSDCNVTVTCKKNLTGPETAIGPAGPDESPVEIPRDEFLRVGIAGNRKERIFRVALPHPGQIRITAGPNPYVTYLRVLDRSMNPVGQTWNYANYPAELAIQTDSECVYIGVSGDAPDSPALSSTLLVSCQTVIDPYEPNNTFETALPVRFGEILRPFLFPRNDADFFAVEVNNPGVIRARLKASVVSTRVIISDAAGKELANSWNYANYDIDIICPVYDPGLYRVAVTPTDPSSFALSAAVLRVDFLSTGSVVSDYQPENIREIPLAFGKWAGGIIFPARRLYRYRLTAETTGLLKLFLYLPDCACSLTVKDERGKVISTSWNYANYSLAAEVPLPRAGTYFAETRATDNSGASLKNFGLLAYFYPNDEYEGYQGNESPEKAMEIWFGQNVAGCIAVPGDTDTYSFYVDHPGLVSLRTTPFPISISATVTDADGRQVFGEWNYANYTLDREFHVRNCGYYYIRIQCTDPNGYSPAAYGFVLDLLRVKPGPAGHEKALPLPLNTGRKIDCLLPGSRTLITVPLPQPVTARLGTVAPVSSSLVIRDSSNNEVFNSWNYANYRIEGVMDIKTPTSLTGSLSGTTPDVWARQPFFVYVTDSDLPPEPSLTLEGIDDNNRNILFLVSAQAAGGRTIVSYEMDFEGTGHFVAVKPGLTGHTYTRGGMYTTELKVTDDRGAVGSESIFVDITDAVLNRLSCRIERPRDGEVVAASGDIYARCSTGPGKPVRGMRLFLDGHQVSARPLSFIQFTPKWKNLDAGEHTVRAEAAGASGETADDTVRFRLHDVFDLWPENGSLVSGVRAVITWFSPTPADTLVEYRKKGDTAWSRETGARGREHRIVLENLQSGIPYEFRAGNGQVFSEIRDISLFKGLAFEQPRYGVTIPRAYGQQMPVTVKNYSDQTQEVVLESLQHQHEDLLAGFIGEGSEDRPIRLSPGELRQFVLSLSAQDCLQELHRFLIRIRSKDGYSDQAEVEVKVKIPRFDLTWTEIESNPDTLGRKVRLTNNGDSLTDISVCIGPENAFRLRPKVEHRVLEAGNTLDIWVDPVLSEDFVHAAGELSVSSLNKSAVYPVQCAVPDGLHVYRVRVDPTLCELISSWYCTNRPFLQLFLQKMNYLECLALGKKTNILAEILQKMAKKNVPYDKNRFFEELKTLEDAARKEGYTLSQLITALRKIWYPSSKRAIKFLGISCEGDAFSILIPDTDAIRLPVSWGSPPCSLIIANWKKSENRDIDIDGKLVDMGHVFAGADAANHPTSIDLLLVKMSSNHEAATFLGDLGSVVIECMVGDDPSPDQLDQNPSLVNYYYHRVSSPADMEGNIDSFLIRFSPQKSVTDTLKDYYAGYSQQTAYRDFVRITGYDGSPAASEKLEKEVYAAAIAYAAANHREFIFQLYGPVADNDPFGRLRQANLLIATGVATRIAVQTFNRRLKR